MTDDCKVLFSARFSGNLPIYPACWANRIQTCTTTVKVLCADPYTIAQFARKSIHIDSLALQLCLQKQSVHGTGIEPIT